MPTGYSRRIIELVAGRRRARPLPTLLVALSVTALVAIPLANRVANSAETPGTVPEPVVMVDMVGSDPLALDGSTIAGDALISFTDPSADGASFSLYSDDGGDQPILSGQDLSGPSFFPILDDSGGGEALDTTLLNNGDYSLFVTVANAQGEQRTVASFKVANP